MLSTISPTLHLPHITAGHHLPAPLPSSQPDPHKTPSSFFVPCSSLISIHPTSQFRIPSYSPPSRQTPSALPPSMLLQPFLPSESSRSTTPALSILSSTAIHHRGPPIAGNPLPSPVASPMLMTIPSTASSGADFHQTPPSPNHHPWSGQPPSSSVPANPKAISPPPTGSHLQRPPAGSPFGLHPPMLDALHLPHNPIGRYLPAPLHQAIRANSSPESVPRPCRVRAVPVPPCRLLSTAATT